MKSKPTYEELERRVQELETDYSQLEEKLQVADFFSEEITRYMTEGLVLTDVREIVIFINQRLSDMLGYLPEQIIGKCWLDMVATEQQTIAQEAVARRAQKHIDRYEIFLRHKDGHKFPVLIGAGPRFDKKSGEFIGTMGVVNDITERKRVEETLREKTNFLQNIIDTTSDLVSVTDMEGNFTFVGPSHSILGYELDSLVGRNVMELVHPDDYQETASAFADFITNREDGRKVEYRCRRIDGDYLWFETVGKFILDDTGNPKEILFRTRDFTAHKRTEGELQRIEWMLSRKPISNIEAQAKNHDQGYGDLTELNRDGVILKSIGHERLKNFANDYLELLGTSSAIYEANGDYAFGIFASGWCRMMDSASRKLCNTPDNVKALNSGRWLCHESCWTDCSKEAMAKRAPVDIECKGGLRLYAVPIFANGDVIGVINFGYGDPTKDPEKLKILADVYHLNQDELLREAKAYDSRPPYIIEMAKKRLSSTAELIGSMVETKKAMEALRDREESLQSIFDNSPSQISEFDLEGRYIRVNHAVAKLLERHSSEFVGKSFNEILPADTAELFMKRVKLVSNTCKPITVEDHLVTPEGDRHFITTIFPLIDASGRIRRFGGIANDITERKQAEEALREGETRYKALHNASFGGIAIHDQGIILECNQGLSEMTGYEYTELIGMDGLLLIAERSRESVMNNIRNGYEKSYEAFGLRKNGEEYPIRLEARNVPYKGKQVRTVEFRDITERKEAEEALHSEVKKFQTLVENTVDWVWQLDPTGHYNYVSPLAEKLIGYTVEEILGKSPFDFMSPSEAERIMPIFSKIQDKHERIVGLEDTLIAKDGTKVFFETNAAPLFGKEGDFIGYMQWRKINRTEIPINSPTPPG